MTPELDLSNTLHLQSTAFPDGTVTKHTEITEKRLHSLSLQWQQAEERKVARRAKRKLRIIDWGKNKFKKQA